MKPTIEQRLWGRIKIASPDECWEWKGRPGKNGYCKMCVNGKDEYIHRIVYQLTKGPIPEGFDVCHKCDNRKCGNPLHLFAGTRYDNLHDMIDKGRADHTKNLKLENHAMAKLTNEQVRQIRYLYDGGMASQIELSKQFCVTNGAIWRIVHRKNWPSIEPSS